MCVTASTIHTRATYSPPNSQNTVDRHQACRAQSGIHSIRPQLFTVCRSFPALLRASPAAWRALVSPPMTTVLKTYSRTSGTQNQADPHAHTGLVVCNYFTSHCVGPPTWQSGSYQPIRLPIDHTDRKAHCLEFSHVTCTCHKLQSQGRKNRIPTNISPRACEC